MKSLSGWIYIIIGATVSIVSWYTNYKKLIFFFFVGLLFFMIGIIKELFLFLRKNLDKGKRSKHHSHPPHIKEKPNPRTQPQELNYMLCPGCGTKVHKSFKFCPNCGYKLY
jgi:DNA-directed RNA polymerase subunit RPC12/RpoP